LRDCLSTDVSARAPSVLDHNLLAPHLGQPAGQRPRERVTAPACCEVAKVGRPVDAAEIPYAALHESGYGPKPKLTDVRSHVGCSEAKPTHFAHLEFFRF
jgi:hypothetical protein